jgi:PST family polysaccharide transporter
VVAVVLAVAGDALLPIYAAYVGVATLVGAYAFLRLMRSVRNLMFDKRLVKVIVTFSRWLFAANVAYIAFQRLDVFLLTAFASLPDVGEYSAGLRVVQIVSLLTGTLAPALLPRATQATQAAPLLRAYLKQSAGLSLVIAILASAVWIAAPMIVTLFFGSQYRDAATVTRVFLIGTVLVAIYTPLSQLLLGYTQPRRVFYLAVLKLCVIGGSGVLLVPRLAGPGAALAVTLSEAAALLYVLLALRRRILAAFVQPRPATIS